MLPSASSSEGVRNDLDVVFPNPLGAPQDPDRVYRRSWLLRREGGRLDIPPIRFHDLRHTHATLVLEDALDAKYVSQRLGHDSVQTTFELYGHVSSRRRQDAALRIGAMLDDGSTPKDPVPENEGGATRSDPSPNSNAKPAGLTADRLAEWLHLGRVGQVDG